MGRRRRSIAAAVTASPLALLAIAALLAGLVSATPASALRTLSAWGANDAGTLGGGALGDGTTVNRLNPVAVLAREGVGLLSGVAAVDGGSLLSVALMNDGTVWVWGTHEDGPYLGAGAFQHTPTPLQVLGPGGVGLLDHIVAVSAGNGHTLALEDDGTVWAWGVNFNGQLGNDAGGSGTDEPFPGQVKGPGGVGVLQGIVAVSAGQGHSLALASDGTVWAWGLNVKGAIGDDTPTERRVPVQVHDSDGDGAFDDVIAIAAGAEHSLALKSDGTVWMWGYNGLVVPDAQFRYLPVRVHESAGVDPPAAGPVLSNIVAIGAGVQHSVALDQDGVVWTWGSARSGQSGLGVVGAGIDFANPVTLPEIATAIAAGGFHNLVLLENREVWGWGANDAGQIGIGSIDSPQPAPVKVVDSGLDGLLADVVAVGAGRFHSFALRDDLLAALDTDGDGNSGALTDGLLTLRHLFGFSGPTLTNGATEQGCTRCAPEDVVAYLEELGLVLDVDGDGIRGALTDGLLFVRHLFGFTGSLLVSGAVGDECQRCDAAQIEDYLQDLD